MAIDPVVFEVRLPQVPVPPPESKWSKLLRLLRLTHFGPRQTKIITALAGIVISVTMISFAVFSVVSNDTSFRQKHGLNITPQEQAQESGSRQSAAAMPGGGSATGIGGTTGTNSPVVTLTATPATVTAGSTAKLTWSATNKPTSCIASDDWSGSKPTKGSSTTAKLTKVQTYLYTLTCKTATGTGFSTVGVQVIQQGGTGQIETRPTVTLAASPSSIYTGDMSTLTWSVTNNPTSCTASGDWGGAKNTTGPATTGTLSIAKTYTYTLTCANGKGSGYATATVKVSDPPPNLPIVTISSNPVGPVTPGSKITLSWKATNNPTSCTASGDWGGSKPASGSQKTSSLTSIRTYNFKITCSNSSGGTFDSAAIQVLPRAPVVSLSVSPTTIYKGSSATISWNASNNPTSCTASGDWGGSKPASGSQSTGIMNTTGVYSYNLSCTNAGGTGYTNNVKLTVVLPPAPLVSITTNPISISTGNSSNITWSATNTPNSCTASGDWGGSKPASGSQGTGTLSTARTYTYVLFCSNDGGSDTASASVNVSSSGGSATAPVVSLNINPTTIGTGSSATISWSVANNPSSCTAGGSWSGTKSASGSQSTGIISTAGTRSYTLSCTNSSGSDSASVNLSVIAKPAITISVSPSSLNTGSSATVNWSVANNPSSCTASGSWSGSKAASGSQTTGTISTAGTYTYTLSCSNSGGTTSNSATLTANNPAPVYCGGKTPCYGPNDLASHASPGNCWGWNLDWVINITSFRPKHPGGIRSGSSSTLENASATCNHDIHTILAGSAGIPGYRDSSGSTTHNHNSSTKNNSSSTQLAAYRTGYYDPSKP